ncbi:MAG: hypothetical protein HYY06_19730 [Deltaproteobacteria bacterium]|nr:hypothetical protein [Deltaproteobacteria bacterium]
MRSRACPWSVVLGWLVVFPVAASGQEPLADVEQMVRELRYEEALERARAVRSEPRTSPEIRLRAVELQATAHLGLGDETAAREAFAELLALDPGYRLANARPSPRVQDVFLNVQQTVRPRLEGQLIVAVAAPSIDGSPAAVSALPAGEHALVRVAFEVRGNGPEVTIDAEPGGPPWRADVPVDSREAARRIGIVGRGYAPSGELAAVSELVRAPAPTREARGGEPDTAPAAPRSSATRRRPEREPGIVERPWFWATIGAVVVVGTFVLLALSGGSSEPAASGASE